MAIFAGKLLRLPAVSHTYSALGPVQQGGYTYTANVFDWANRLVRADNGDFDGVPPTSFGNADFEIRTPNFNATTDGRITAGLVGVFGQENTASSTTYPGTAGSAAGVTYPGGGPTSDPVTMQSRDALSGDIYQFAATSGRFTYGKGLVILDGRMLISGLPLDYGASPPVPGDFSLTFTPTAGIFGFYGGLSWEGDGILGGDITNATNANPIVVTTGADHGLATGDEVTTSAVGGVVSANGTFTITVLSDTSFSLDGSDGIGDDPYTSGGKWQAVESEASIGFEGSVTGTVDFTNVTVPDASFVSTVESYFQSCRIVLIAPDGFADSTDAVTSGPNPITGNRLNMAIWNGLKTEIEAAHVAFATTLAAAFGAELEFIDAADYSADFSAREVELIDEVFG